MVLLLSSTPSALAAYVAKPARVKVAGVAAAAVVTAARGLRATVAHAHPAPKATAKAVAATGAPAATAMPKMTHSALSGWPKRRLA